jgi:hypothetical protein
VEHAAIEGVSSLRVIAAAKLRKAVKKQSTVSSQMVLHALSKKGPFTRSPRIMDSVLFGAASVAALSWVWLARREREPEVEYSHAETIEAITNAYGYGNRIRKNFFLDFVRYTHVNHGSYGTCPSDVWNAALKAMLQVRPCSLVVFNVYGANICTVATSVPLAGGELP